MSKPETPQKAEQEHLDAVREVLARAYRRNGGEPSAVDNHTPLDALLQQEDGVPDDFYAAGVDMLRRFLGWVFEQGPHPASVTQRIYSVTNAVCPELLLNMSGEEIAALFGQGRAAESARTIMLNKKLKSVGFKHTTFRHQKSETARKRMALSALGNRNRRKSRKSTAA